MTPCPPWAPSLYGHSSSYTGPIPKAHAPKLSRNTVRASRDTIPQRNVHRTDMPTPEGGKNSNSIMRSRVIVRRRQSGNVSTMRSTPIATLGREPRAPPRISALRLLHRRSGGETPNKTPIQLPGEDGSSPMGSSAVRDMEISRASHTARS